MDTLPAHAIAAIAACCDAGTLSSLICCRSLHSALVSQESVWKRGLARLESYDALLTRSWGWDASIPATSKSFFSLSRCEEAAACHRFLREAHTLITLQVASSLPPLITDEVVPHTSSSRRRSGPSPRMSASRSRPLSALMPTLCLSPEEEVVALAALHAEEERFRSRQATPTAAAACGEARVQGSRAASTHAVRRMLALLHPSKCAHAAEMMSSSGRSRRVLVVPRAPWMRLERTLCTALRASMRHASASTQERAAGELLVDIMNDELTPAPGADNAITGVSCVEGDPHSEYTPAYSVGQHVASPLHVSRAASLIAAPPRVDDAAATGIALQSPRGAMTYTPQLGGSFGVATAVKCVAVHGDRVLVADRGGAIRITTRHGQRVAAGRVARTVPAVSTSNVEVAGLERQELHHALSSAAMHDSRVLTGHPDGSAVLSAASGGSMRVLLSFAAEDVYASGVAARVGPRRAASTSVAPTAGHTVVAFMDEGAHFLVARRLHRLQGRALSCGDVTVHATDVGTVTRRIQVEATSALPSLPTSMHVLDSNVAVLGYSDGVLRLVDLRTSRAVCGATKPNPCAPRIAVAFDTAPLRTPGELLPAVDDSSSAVRHITANNRVVVETRASPLFPAIGDPMAVFAPLSSPFVRVWDMRTMGSSSDPACVIDLGASAVRAVAGIHLDAHALAIAHQYVLAPEQEAAAVQHADAEGHEDVPPDLQFHWNVGDRARNRVRTDARVDARTDVRSRMWWHVLQSDVHMPLVPSYAWPAHHAPPTVNLDDSRRPPARAVVADTSALSFWHPTAFTNVGYVPLPSVTCLAASASCTVVGTDAGAMTWTYTPPRREAATAAAASTPEEAVDDGARSPSSPPPRVERDRERGTTLSSRSGRKRKGPAKRRAVLAALLTARKHGGGAASGDADVVSDSGGDASGSSGSSESET